MTPSVLFFGREDCHSTRLCLEHLEMLGFNIQCVFSRGKGESLPLDLDSWEGDYIFCFRSYFILPLWLINRARVAAVNFHPAPPEYPGNGCLNFALYDRASEYGVTAHLMNEKVDNGPILMCQRFCIFDRDNVASLLTRSHHYMLGLFYEVSSRLRYGGKEALQELRDLSANERWSGEARKMRELDALQMVSADIDQAELERVIRATHTPQFPVTLKLHGYQFVLKKN